MKDQRFCIPFPWDLAGFRKRKIDVIHAQVTSSSTGYFALLAGRLFGIPVVHTYHTLFIEYVHYTPLPRRLARIGVKFLSRTFCNACERIIAPSTRVVEELRSYGVHKPIDIIPTGMDCSLIPEAVPFDRRRFRIPEGRRLLCFIGRTGREKNIPFLYAVMELLLARRSDIHMVIIGDGPERAEIQGEGEKRGLGPFLTFTGYLPRRELLGVLAASDVFTFCSKTETQGIVILEAMAAGTPVVAIDAMGVKDVLEDGAGGILVPDDVDLFARSVERILDDEAYAARLSAGAREKARQYSSRKTAEALAETYARAAARHGGRKGQGP
jgi:glycosyltransferase involved in cell wall biosynthesis